MMCMENENAAYIDPRNTEEYQRLATRLREVNEQLDIMNQSNFVPYNPAILNKTVE